MRTILLAIVLTLATIGLARTRTTQPRLASSAAAIRVIDRTSVDTTEAPAEVDPYLIEIRGFNKRASDSKETFFLTNRSTHRLSGVRLLLRYSLLDGEPLHERRVTVSVDLRPGETRLVEIKSFDTQRLFYYHGSSKPRKSATPFDVAYLLTGYDIPVGH